MTPIQFLKTAFNVTVNFTIASLFLSPVVFGIIATTVLFVAGTTATIMGVSAASAFVLGGTWQTWYFIWLPIVSIFAALYATVKANEPF